MKEKDLPQMSEGTAIAATYLRALSPASGRGLRKAVNTLRENFAPEEIELQLAERILGSNYRPIAGRDGREEV